MENKEYISILKTHGTVTKVDGVIRFKIIRILKPCELNCGAIIRGQIIVTKFYLDKRPHCRRKCKTCGSWELPNGDVSLNKDIIQYGWDRELKKRYPDVEVITKYK